MTIAEQRIDSDRTHIVTNPLDPADGHPKRLTSGEWRFL
jgi:hypothetical protein